MSDVRYWQDMEMTLPAKDDGDRVAVIEDTRGNQFVQPVFERRPIMKDGVAWFDYTDDFFLGGKGPTTLMRYPDGTYREICGGRRTMSAPERIWADWDAMHPEQNGGHWWGEQCAGQAYVRADLHDTLRAERDALAARVEKLTALVERAYCEGFEYAVALDPDCEWGGGNQWPDSDAKRELDALAETQEG